MIRPKHYKIARELGQACVISHVRWYRERNVTTAWTFKWESIPGLAYRLNSVGLYIKPSVWDQFTDQEKDWLEYIKWVGIMSEWQKHKKEE